MEKLLDVYDKFNFLVSDIYNECIGSGYSKNGAANKVKYELEPMIENEEERIILFFELCYFFAKEDLTESFISAYKIFDNLSKSDEIKEFINKEVLIFKNDQILKYFEHL